MVRSVKTQLPCRNRGLRRENWKCRVTLWTETTSRSHAEAIHPSPDGVTAYDSALGNPAWRDALGAPGRPLTSADSSAPPREDWGARVVVWYGTDRQRIGSDESTAFANVRSTDGTVHYGRCEVNVPVGHRFGSVGRPRWAGWLRPSEGDRLALERIAPFESSQEFLVRLSDHLNDLSSI